jgi:phage tail-like protein
MRTTLAEMPSTKPLASLLPAMLQADDFCVRFTQGLDPSLTPILTVVDNLDSYVDPWLTPRDFLDWLAGWFGAELDATWPEERCRALVANAVELARWRGTVAGLAMLIELYTGVPAEIDDGGGVTSALDPDEPLPGRVTSEVVVRFAGPTDLDVGRLTRLVRTAVPAHIKVRCVRRKKS